MGEIRGSKIAETIFVADPGFILFIYGVAPFSASEKTRYATVTSQPKGEKVPAVDINLDEFLR